MMGDGVRVANEFIIQERMADLKNLCLEAGVKVELVAWFTFKDGKVRYDWIFGEKNGKR